MKFFLGTHVVNWLDKSSVPLFVSRRQLYKRKTFPAPTCEWAIDSGGFTELNMYGRWTVSEDQYVDEVLRFNELMPGMQWAAPQDWMCEPQVLQKTGKTVEEHQILTIDNFLKLREKSKNKFFIPVIQGWEPKQYINHVKMYFKSGIDLRTEPIVGMGTICRRQATGGVAPVIKYLSELGIKIHGFGLKKTGLPKLKDFIASSDSMAWSFTARYKDPLPGCSHRNCANCFKFAMKWREELIDGLK